MANTQIESQQTRWLLEQWGRWARVNPGISLTYPKETIFSRLIGSTVSEVLISDSEAKLVDGAVAKLNKRMPDSGQAVMLYYLVSCNASRAAKILGVNRKRYEVLLSSGVAWVDASLNTLVNVINCLEESKCP